MGFGVVVLEVGGVVFGVVGAVLGVGNVEASLVVWC